MASRWVRNEFEQAISEELEGQPKRVLPVLLEDCDLPSYLRRLYAGLHQGDDAKFKKMLETIRNLGVW